MTNYYILFSDGTDMTATGCVLTFTDSGLHFKGTASDLFVPLGAIKLITDMKEGIKFESPKEKRKRTKNNEKINAITKVDGITEEKTD